MADGVVTQIVGGVGATDYIDSSGNIHKNSIMKSVLVSSQSQLASLSDYAVGTIAYTAGMNEMWQKGADGEWSEIGSGGGGGGGDFSTAEVTIIVDPLNTTTVNATLFNVLTPEYGQIGESSTINEENNTKTIVIYQNKPIYLDDSDEIIESVSGAIEKDSDNSIYWISGNCSITIKKFSVI